MLLSESPYAGPRIFPTFLENCLSVTTFPFALVWVSIFQSASNICLLFLSLLTLYYAYTIATHQGKFRQVSVQLRKEAWKTIFLDKKTAAFPCSSYLFTNVLSPLLSIMPRQFSWFIEERLQYPSSRTAGYRLCTVHTTERTVHCTVWCAVIRVRKISTGKFLGSVTSAQCFFNAVLILAHVVPSDPHLPIWIRMGIRLFPV